MKNWVALRLIALALIAPIPTSAGATLISDELIVVNGFGHHQIATATPAQELFRESIGVPTLEIDMGADTAPGVLPIGEVDIVDPNGLFSDLVSAGVGCGPTGGLPSCFDSVVAFSGELSTLEGGLKETGSLMNLTSFFGSPVFFRSSETPFNTPEPGTLLLMLSGLVPLIAGRVHNLK